MSERLRQQLERLVERLHTGYDHLGNSERCPYVYCVHDPQDARVLPALLREYFHDDPPFVFALIDLLALSIESLSGQEQHRQELLEHNPIGQAKAIEGVWVRRTRTEIEKVFASVTAEDKPVAVLYETAALHPISHPSAFMARWDDDTPLCHPKTGKSIPIVIFIPGYHSPLSSRSYYFLSQQHQALTLYRGEEIEV
jgi:hypothetical protein